MQRPKNSAVQEHTKGKPINIFLGVVVQIPLPSFVSVSAAGALKISAFGQKGRPWPGPSAGSLTSGESSAWHSPFGTGVIVTGMALWKEPKEPAISSSATY